MIRLGRKKKPGKTRSEVRIINASNYGDEPTWVSGRSLTNVEKALALNWYHYMCSHDDAREFLHTWVVGQNLNDKVELLESIGDRSFPLTAAWLARMETRGATIGKDSHEFILRSIEERAKYSGLVDSQNTIVTDAGEVIEKLAANTDELTDKKSDVSKKLLYRIDTFIGDVERVIDTADWKFNTYDALKGNTMPTGVVSRIKTYYEPLLDEINLAVSGKNADVKEGYKSYKKSDLVEKQAWLSSLIADCERYSSNEKKLRVPRKSKPVSVEKKLKYFLYQKEDLELKLASADPAMIVGAQELWTYDTKYKILTVMRAKDESGLDVKRTTITGFDEETSVTKTIGRKAEPILEMVRTSSKSGLSKLMDTLTSKAHHKVKDRNNEYVVILKVVRK
jgi:hypothetical protein